MFSKFFFPRSLPSSFISTYLGLLNMPSISWTLGHAFLLSLLNAELSNNPYILIYILLFQAICTVLKIVTLVFHSNKLEAQGHLFLFEEHDHFSSMIGHSMILKFVSISLSIPQFSLLSLFSVSILNFFRFKKLKSLSYFDILGIRI